MQTHTLGLSPIRTFLRCPVASGYYRTRKGAVGDCPKAPGCHPGLNRKDVVHDHGGRPPKREDLHPELSRARCVSHVAKSCHESRCMFPQQCFTAPRFWSLVIRIALICNRRCLCSKDAPGKPNLPVPGASCTDGGGRSYPELFYSGVLTAEQVDTIYETVTTSNNPNYVTSKRGSLGGNRRG